ncbi:MAG: 4-amino-4-deoxychorismate lyase [Actinobacteria bacterium]|nr:4-amino-4-deoxychorismate lyase [Actinomycetota bacterium]
MKVWVSGTLDELDALRVSPLDHGLLTGDGVFETLRVYGGVPFAWRRHYDRLHHSAEGLYLTVPSSAHLREAADAVLRANGLDEARLRITITGGEAPLGSERGDAPATVLVAACAVSAWPPTTQVVTVPWARNERGATAGIKTISYAENVRALAYAREHGAGEAVFPNTRGELCEATGSNVFLAFAGVLRTPPPEAGCLLGVTRALLLELAAADGIPVEEAALPLDALHRADEAFLSSTTREVQAIAAVDGRALPAAPGRVTTRLRDAFRALVARDLDP